MLRVQIRTATQHPCTYLRTGVFREAETNCDRRDFDVSRLLTLKISLTYNSQNDIISYKKEQVSRLSLVDTANISRPRVSHTT